MTWPAPSPRFAAALQASHTLAIKAEVLLDGQPVLELPSLVVDGTVTMERSIVRTSASLDVTDPRGVLDATTASQIVELLQPVDGHELRLWRGIQFPDEPEPQLVPLGTLVITELTGSWPHLQVEARDRLWLVVDRRGRFRSASQVAAGTNYATAITEVLAATAATGLPDRVPILIDPTAETTPLLTFDAQASRGEEATRMAQALGRILYADRLGTVTTMPEPEAATAPVAARLVEWEADDADQGGAVLLGATATLSAEDATNVVVVDGEATGQTPWHAEAADLDPESVTYTGSFGEHIEFMSNPLLTSQAMADAAARTALANRIGLGASLELEVACNPLLEVADVAYVRRRLGGVDGRHLLDRLSFGLRSARMSISTRDVRGAVSDA